MTTATRSRGFLNLNMPPGSSDKPQPLGPGFNGDNLYPDRSIWQSTSANSRAVPRDAQDPESSPSGSSALAANSEADVWRPKQTNIWSSDHPVRSVSTSPHRARDATVGGIKNSSLDDNKQFQEDDHLFGQSFAAKRAKGDNAYTNAFAEPFPRYTHEPNLPSSRQSQGSPSYRDMVPVNMPKSSFNPKRGLHGHAPSLPPPSANQRAYRLNGLIGEEAMAIQFGRQMTLGNAGDSGAGFQTTAQPPFQFNPGSQPWMGDATSARFRGGIEQHIDPSPSQYGLMNRAPERAPSDLEYRAAGGANSPGGYHSNTENWSSRLPTRLQRNSADMRAHAEQNAAFGPYYLNQFPYSNLPSPYPPSFVDIYGQGQGFRHNLIAAHDTIPVPPSGYPLAALTPMPASRAQESRPRLRSVLLDDFRANNKLSRRYELKDIYDHVVEFSGDQHGSRFIQQKLETASGEEKDRVFREIEQNAVQLMKDVFGNYVIQKFFEHGNQVQKKVLAERIKGKAVDLSMQIYACRVVQKALEHILVEQQIELARELEPDILRVIRDQNGNHVVQKIIELLPRQYTGFIMDAVRGQVAGLSSHTFGCRVVQRLLEHGSETDKLELMNELHATAQILTADQFGNYVAQHVLQHGKPDDRDKMIRVVMGQLLTLSKHKFASNVVEHCIEYGTDEHRTSIKDMISAFGSDGISPSQQMMRDQYGNYVIQKLIKTLRDEEQYAFAVFLRPQLETIKKTGGSRQLQIVEKLIDDATSSWEAKHGTSGGNTDGTSTADTPALTNETSSPQTSSPGSAHVSAVDLLNDNGGQPYSDKLAQPIDPRVRQEEL